MGPPSQRDQVNTTSFDASVRLRWIQRSVTVGVVLLIGVLVLPALQQAREAARRTQSKNNLKMLGLALENYHGTHQMYPPGGTFDSAGRGHHGWIPFLWCYLDANPYYNQIDFNQPWDAPHNAGFFTCRLSTLLNPSIVENSSSTKPQFVVSHYSVNANLFFANSFSRRSELESPGETFLAGELGGDFVPWGCPYNWRPLNGLTDTPRTYGRLENQGGQFLIGDGSVRWVTPDVAPEILSRLRGPNLNQGGWPHMKVVRPDTFPFPTEALIPTGNGFRNQEGEKVELFIHPDKRDWEPGDSALEQIAHSPKLIKLTAFGDFTDAGVSSLPTLTLLEELRLSSPLLSDQGLGFLRRWPALKKLYLHRRSITPKLLDVLVDLPNLADLEVDASEITDELPELVSRLPQLRRFKLTLRSDEMTDHDLEVIARVPRLTELCVVSNQITDDGLAKLCELRDLLRLQIAGQQITKLGVTRLKQSLPECEVFHREW